MPGRDLIARMAAVYELHEELLLAQAGYPVGHQLDQPPEVQQAVALLHQLSADGRHLSLGLSRLPVEQGR